MSSSMATAARVLRLDPSPGADAIAAPVVSEALQQAVIGCATEVHRVLGPGLPRTLYREALALELERMELRARTAVRIAVHYKHVPLGGWLEADLLVEERLLLEIAAGTRIATPDMARMLARLKLAGLRCGLIIDFGAARLRQGVRRVCR